MTADEVLRELLGRGLLARGAAVAGGVISVSDPARGWFRFLEKPRTQLFVRSGHIAVREAALLARLGPAEFVPTIRAAEEELFVVESFPAGLDVVEFHRMTRRIAEWLPALIGRTLAAVHATSGDGLPRDLPPAFAGANVAPPVAQAIARLASGWRGGALLHGSPTFTRIIVAPEPERRIHLIDWDHARAGDPSWDLGAVIEAYYAWSLDPAIVSDVEGPVCPLPPHALAMSLSSLRAAYVTSARLDAAEAHERFVRAFGYAGVWMIGRVERALRKPGGASPQLTQMMQAAVAMITAPAVVAQAFFAPAPPAWPRAWGTW